MAKSKGKPGIYIWFNQWNPATKRLNFDQKGRLIDAVIRFGESGVYTSFDDDPLLDMAFEILANVAEEDDQNYADAVAKKKLSGHYSRFISKARPDEKVSFDEWLAMNPGIEREAIEYGDSKKRIHQESVEHIQQVLTGANTCQPITITNPIPNSKTKTISISNPMSISNSTATSVTSTDPVPASNPSTLPQPVTRETFMKKEEEKMSWDIRKPFETDDEFILRRKREMIAHFMYLDENGETVDEPDLRVV